MKACSATTAMEERVSGERERDRDRGGTGGRLGAGGFQGVVGASLATQGSRQRVGAGRHGHGEGMAPGNGVGGGERRKKFSRKTPLQHLK